jgi:purine-nucleoside phosphorylase
MGLMGTFKKYSLPDSDIAIVLGSGHEYDYGSIEKSTFVPYTQFLPSKYGSLFDDSDGMYFCENSSRKKFVIFNRRLHRYQGFSFLDSVLPIRIAKTSGVRKVMLVNSAGGINPNLNAGDLVVVNRQVLIPPPPDFKPEFSKIDQSVIEKPYDTKLSAQLSEIVKSVHGNFSYAVYAFVLGPAYETDAEIEFLKKLGADIVGMSTAYEAIYSNLAGLETCTLSLVSNVHSKEKHVPLSHTHVIDTALKSKSVLKKIIDEFINAV